MKTYRHSHTNSPSDSGNTHVYRALPTSFVPHYNYPCSLSLIIEVSYWHTFYSHRSGVLSNLRNRAVKVSIAFMHYHSSLALLQGKHPRNPGRDQWPLGSGIPSEDMKHRGVIGRQIHKSTFKANAHYEHRVDASQRPWRSGRWQIFMWLPPVSGIAMSCSTRGKM
jgi:hypothetical protein